MPAHRRLLTAPLIAHVTPGLRRYAYGRSRPLAASLVARAVAPAIAREARGADVIHMWAGDLLASAAVRAGELAGVPVVITPFAHRGQWGYDSASLRAYDAAARTIALLETEAHLYEEFGIDRARIDVLGVCSAGVPVVDRERGTAKLGVDGPLVLFLGARREYKGFDLLLQAAPTVTSSHPAATFAFVGPGPALSEVPAGCRILDVGAVDEDDKALWLNAADVLCLPSAAEILPGSILEAWSVGTPGPDERHPAARRAGRRGISRPPRGSAARRDRAHADRDARRPCAPSRDGRERTRCLDPALHVGRRGPPPRRDVLAGSPWRHGGRPQQGSRPGGVISPAMVTTFPEHAPARYPG